MQYTSLSKVLEAAAVSGNDQVTVHLAVNRGRITTVEYRRTFDSSEFEEADDEQTDELTATVALLRQYGRQAGKGKVPYALTFTNESGAAMFVSATLVKWMSDKAGLRETVPAELVEQLDVGTETVVAEVVAGTGRRDELEDLKVEEVRKLAASYKLAGAWRTRKGELIDKIIAWEAAEAS